MKNLISITLLCFSTLLFSQNGLVGEYYNGTNFEQKILTRTDAKIDFNWSWGVSPGKGVDRSYYSVRWTGELFPPETGQYLFSAKFDDGIRLWVNDVPMLDAWGLHDEGDFSNAITLEANKKCSLKVEYFNAMREGEITVLWQIPSDIKAKKKAYQVISEKYFVQPIVVAEVPQPTIPPIVVSKTAPVAKPKSEISKPKTPSVKKAKKSENTVVSFEKMDNDLDIKQVFFIRSINKMTDNSMERLDKVVQFLKKNPTAKVELNGHTDVMGDVKMNVELSINRAKGVSEYLISKGIAENRIRFQGFGSSKPIVPNPQTEEERAVNRRVEFLIK